MTALRAKRGKKGKNKKAGRRSLNLFLLFLLAAATMTAGFFFIFLHDGGKTLSGSPTILKKQAKKTIRPPAYEEPATSAPPAAPGTAGKKTSGHPPPGKPLVAIIVDDMGYQPGIGRGLLALDLPLSFAFLPFAPFNQELLTTAHAKGRDILLHLPLEAADPKWNPGPGALSTAMDTYTLKASLHKDLKAVPQAIGINNHMGSRFTADPAAMRRLFGAMQDLDLFFVDSLTSPKSAAYGLAGQMGVRAGRRNVFLDNEQIPEKIISQLESLISYAKKHGQAVGICHPHPATLEALRRFRPQLLKQTEVVGIHRLVH
ncbi:divergent polysaccharide deacetylase family protein [Thiovibrio sp. JS02]